MIIILYIHTIVLSYIYNYCHFVNKNFKQKHNTLERQSYCNFDRKILTIDKFSKKKKRMKTTINIQKNEKERWVR